MVKKYTSAALTTPTTAAIAAKGPDIPINTGTNRDTRGIIRVKIPLNSVPNALTPTEARLKATPSGLNSKPTRLISLPKKPILPPADAIPPTKDAIEPPAYCKLPTNPRILTAANALPKPLITVTAAPLAIIIASAPPTRRKTLFNGVPFAVTVSNHDARASKASHTGSITVFKVSNAGERTSLNVSHRPVRTGERSSIAVFKTLKPSRTRSATIGVTRLIISASGGRASSTRCINTGVTEIIPSKSAPPITEVNFSNTGTTSSTVLVSEGINLSANSWSFGARSLNALTSDGRIISASFAI